LFSLGLPASPHCPLIVSSLSLQKNIMAKNAVDDVDRILEKRLKAGKIEYKVKWLGFGEDDANWEPIDNLNCPEKIAEFEANELTANGKEVKRKATTPLRPKKKRERHRTPQIDEKIDYSSEEVSLLSEKPKRVSGLCKIDGTIYAFLEFSGNKKKLVSIHVASKYCPGTVCDFLEKKLVFTADNSDPTTRA